VELWGDWTKWSFGTGASFPLATLSGVGDHEIVAEVSDAQGNRSFVTTRITVARASNLYVNPTVIDIPDAPPFILGEVSPATHGGIVSTIFVPDSFVVLKSEVEVLIGGSNPTIYVDDLDITLTSPSGSVVVLHDHGISGVPLVGFRQIATFDGENALGTWTLAVEDVLGIGITACVLAPSQRMSIERNPRSGADGHLILAVGNDAQFLRFCRLAGLETLAGEARFATNDARVRHRDELIPQVAEAMKRRPRSEWLAALGEEGIPCGPINDVGQAFAEDQAIFRKLATSIVDGGGIPVPTVQSPLGLSLTPPSLRSAPPRLGEHTREVLREVAGLDEAAADRLVGKFSPG
jgi:hypothetical protein